MCFSAPVSFAASAFLIPTGVYCFRTAWDRDPAYLPLATMPVEFGIQQASEGILWLGISADQQELVDSCSLLFLFFSHLFWLFWTPFSAYRLEQDQRLKKLIGGIMVFGGVYGSLIYVPLLFNLNWLNLRVLNGSIYYDVHLTGEDLIPKSVYFVIYTLVILLPLLISSNNILNRFGSLISLSAVITEILFDYAFISVWCFFAAIMSLYLTYQMNRVTEFKPG